MALPWDLHTPFKTRNSHWSPVQNSVGMSVCDVTKTGQYTEITRRICQFS